MMHPFHQGTIQLWMSDPRDRFVHCVQPEQEHYAVGVHGNSAAVTAAHPRTLIGMHPDHNASSDGCIHSRMLSVQWCLQHPTTLPAQRAAIYTSDRHRSRCTSNLRSEMCRSKVQITWHAIDSGRKERSKSAALPRPVPRRRNEQCRTASPSTTDNGAFCSSAHCHQETPTALTSLVPCKPDRMQQEPTTCKA
jgi:hypothetical protein